MIDRQHNDREGAFQGGMLVKIVDDDFRVRVSLQLDHDTGIFIGLVADRRDIGEDFFVDQFRDALNQCRAINVVRDFGNNDLFFPALEFFDAGLAAHLHAAAPGL